MEDSKNTWRKIAQLSLFCGSSSIKFLPLFFQKRSYGSSCFLLSHFNSSSFILVVLQKACPTTKSRIIEHHVGLILRRMEISHQISFWNLSYWHNHEIFYSVNELIEADKSKDLYDFFTNLQSLNTHQNMESSTSIAMVHWYNMYFLYFLNLQSLEEFALQVYFHSIFLTIYMLFKFSCIDL